MKYLAQLSNTKALKDLTKNELSDLQQALYNLGYTEIWIDGIYGQQTRRIFNKFKVDNALTYPDLIGHTTVDFITKKLEKEDNNKDFIFLTTPQVINNKLMIVKVPNNWQQKKLGNEDYTRLANLFGLSVPTIRAVMDVESSGSGFLLNELAPCRPKILFEGHIFYRQTPKPVSQTRPDLSHARWTKQFYKGGSAEWGRLLDAMKFDPLAAVRSASWGLGQVMGFNFSMVGYNTVEEMIIDCHKGEFEQARQMFNFCKNHPSKQLIPALKSQSWGTFAYYYNGAGYRQNQYDIKLRDAYRRYAR